jgi:ABC-type transport system substrate-binding protein
MKKKHVMLLSLSVAALLLGLMYKMTRSEAHKNLKISLAGTFREQITPENISTIALYHVNTNVWDTLITNDRSPAIARITHISADHLIYNFEISEFAKFSNGRKITADDVKFSIDRTIAREENGHANARGMIQGVAVKAPNQVEITLNAATPSFMFVISTPEFAIVPREICDPKDLSITNLSITSGAYTVRKIDKEKKEIFLEKNKFFERHVQNSPDSVEISFDSSTGESFDAVKSGNQQFYEIYNSFANNLVNNLSENKSKLSYSVTKPSLSVFLNRNPKKISSEHAAEFSALVRKYFSYDTQTEKKSFQFLPPRTFGSLESTELPQLQIKNNLKEVTIKFGNIHSPVILALKQIESKANIKINIVDAKSDIEADFSGDSQGMNADYPEIELYLSLLSPYAFIPVPTEAKELITKAFHESDDSKRSQLIKRISVLLLESGSIVPLTVRSYVHVFDSESVDAAGVATYDGDIPIWKIRML